MQVRFYDHQFGHFSARHHIGTAVWDHFDLLWIHTGRVSLQLTDQPEQSLTANQGLLIYPDTPFQGRSLTATSRSSIQHFGLDGTSAQGLPVPLDQLWGLRQGGRCYEARDVETFERDVARAMFLANQEPSPLLHAMRVAQLVLLLAQLELARNQPTDAQGKPDRFEELLKLMAQRLQEPLSLEEMAEQVDLSTSHFRALFRRRMGVSPVQFQLQLRMNEAARLLRETSEPIKTVARHLGYGELPNFYRSFKAVMGHTPRDYRQQNLLRG